VLDDDINENDVIDIDTLDESTVTAATDVIKTAQVVDQHENSLNNDYNDDDHHVQIDASTPNSNVQHTEWIGCDDETYTGDLVDGVFHGSGTYTCSTYKYTGEFDNGQMHGKGEIIYSDGDTYKGSFELDDMQGHGEHTTSKVKCVGEYRNGMQHGAGEIVYVNGTSYKGEFVDDLPHGIGEFIYSLSRYVGQVQKVMNMDKAKRCLLMVIYMKATFSMACIMDMVNTLAQITHIMANTTLTNNVAKV
jgi:hypothetical protein